MDLSLAMQTRWVSLALASCLLSLVVANHRRTDQDGLGEDLVIGHSQDEHDGEIVIEHRHRPRVHKSFGSGQYVIPAAALLPQRQHDLGGDQGAEESADYFGRGGEVYDAETNTDYIEDFNVDDTELYLAEGSSTISPASQSEEGDHMDKLGAGEPGQDTPGRGNSGADPGKKRTKEERGTAVGQSGQSDKVATKESSRTALSKLLRLLIAAYI